MNKNITHLSDEDNMFESVCGKIIEEMLRNGETWTVILNECNCKECLRLFEEKEY